MSKHWYAPVGRQEQPAEPSNASAPAPPQPPASQPQSAQLLPLPLFHVTGFHSTLVAALAKGTKLVLMYKWDVDQALDLVARERIGVLTLVPALRKELDTLGRQDVMIVVGGVIPPGDFDELRAAGAAAIFPPGTVIAEAAEDLIRELNKRLGYGQKAAE